MSDDDKLDVIAAERATLSKALQDPSSDKQEILDQLGDLQDLQNAIIFQNFNDEAQKVAALTDQLQSMIQELQGHINNLFLDQLVNIGTKNGLLPTGTTRETIGRTTGTGATSAATRAKTSTGGAAISPQAAGSGANAG